MRLWRQPSPYGELTVVLTDRGLHEISLPGDDQPEVDVDASPTARSPRQLDDWFAGKRHAFDVDARPRRRSTASAARCWRRSCAKCRGARSSPTASSPALAGRPRAARAVGSAMRNNPIPFVIPCHRVVAAGNKIGGYGGGRNAVALKRELLAREGVSTLR